MPLLSLPQLDSIDELWKVTHGVYLMQSVDDPCLFRFGSLGLKSPNPAVVRLGQCYVLDQTHNRKARWRYILIDDMNGQRNAIHAAEKALKDVFFNAPNKLSAIQISRIGGADRFRACGPEPVTTCHAEVTRARVCCVARVALGYPK
jgi:hypothetical protein